MAGGNLKEDPAAGQVADDYSDQLMQRSALSLSFLLSSDYNEGFFLYFLPISYGLHNHLCLNQVITEVFSLYLSLNVLRVQYLDVIDPAEPDREEKTIDLCE